MRTISFIVMSGLLAGSVARPQNPEAQANVNLPPAQIAGEVAAKRVSNPAKQGDWPSAVYGRDGSLWVV